MIDNQMGTHANDRRSLCRNMKALEFLKDIQEDTPCAWEQLDEAIAELEELQNADCTTCTYFEKSEASSVWHTCRSSDYLSEVAEEGFACKFYEKKKNK